MVGICALVFLLPVHYVEPKYFIIKNKPTKLPSSPPPALSAWLFYPRNGNPSKSGTLHYLDSLSLLKGLVNVMSTCPSDITCAEQPEGLAGFDGPILKKGKLRTPVWVT